MSEVSARDLLLGTGAMCVLATVYFYKKKATVPFKVAYGLSWPTLGTGIILAVQPEHFKAEQAMMESGVLQQQEVQKRHEANSAAMEMIKRAAGQQK